MNSTATKPGILYALRERLRGRNFIFEFYFRGKKTLDIGCGEGEFLKYDKRNTYGVDTNKRAIARLKQEGFLVTEAGAESLPFEKNSFEAVHCRNVIEHLHIEQAYQLIKEAGRVLTPGGVFVLASEVLNSQFWWTFGHVKPYPPEAIIKLLRTESREEFECIDTLEYVNVLYLGQFFRNKLLYFFSFIIAYFTPFLRREYFLILRRK